MSTQTIFQGTNHHIGQQQPPKVDDTTGTYRS
jgi:hypothetical protein